MRTHSFDVVFGSGEKAETFAYWKGNHLYQLPLHFLVKSPGGQIAPAFRQTAHISTKLLLDVALGVMDHILKRSRADRQFISKRKL